KWNGLCGGKQKKKRKSLGKGGGGERKGEKSRGRGTGVVEGAERRGGGEQVAWPIKERKKMAGLGGWCSHKKRGPGALIAMRKE
ncbi:MAG: hypothetical protein AAFU49_24720, partial [Pseudomonadota bacterium]